MPQDMAHLSLFPWSDWVVQPSRTGMLMFNFNAITVDKKYSIHAHCYTD